MKRFFFTDADTKLLDSPTPVPRIQWGNSMCSSIPYSNVEKK